MANINPKQGMKLDQSMESCDVDIESEADLKNRNQGADKTLDMARVECEMKFKNLREFPALRDMASLKVLNLSHNLLTSVSL